MVTRRELVGNWIRAHEWVERVYTVAAWIVAAFIVSGGYLWLPLALGWFSYP